jgi:RNA polymerase sigma factor (sigma-70 family)
MFGLVQAARRFIPEKGVKFSTFATPAIRGQVRAVLRAPDRRKLHLAIAEDQPDDDEVWAWAPEDHRPDPRRQAIQRDLVRKIVRAGKKLGAIQWGVLAAHYLEDADQRAIAEHLGVESYQVRRILKNAEDALLAACRDAGILRPRPEAPRHAN